MHAGCGYHILLIVHTQIMRLHFSCEKNHCIILQLITDTDTDINDKNKNII